MVAVSLAPGHHASQKRERFHDAACVLLPAPKTLNKLANHGFKLRRTRDDLATCRSSTDNAEDHPYELCTSHNGIMHSGALIGAG